MYEARVFSPSTFAENSCLCCLQNSSELLIFSNKVASGEILSKKTLYQGRSYFCCCYTFNLQIFKLPSFRIFSRSNFQVLKFPNSQICQISKPRNSQISKSANSKIFEFSNFPNSEFLTLQIVKFRNSKNF